MFSYRLAETSTSADEDGFDPLVIHVPNLNETTLQLLPAYLLEIYPARLDSKGLDRARPLLFDTDGTHFFSERAIWSLLVELPGAADHVVAYVSRALAHLKDRYVLPLSAPLDIVGQEPLYTYFERFLRRYELTEEGDLSKHFKVVDAFLAFLRRCDMDHETFQHYYIDLVLAFLCWRDDDRLTDLLYFRLTQGQYTEPEPEYAKYLTWHGTFKKIVDRLLQREEGWSLRYSLLEICAVAYGNDLAATNAVLEYCRKLADLEDACDLGESIEKTLVNRRASGQAFLAGYGVQADTGFHVRNEETREWQWTLD